MCSWNDVRRHPNSKNSRKSRAVQSTAVRVLFIINEGALVTWYFELCQPQRITSITAENKLKSIFKLLCLQVTTPQNSSATTLCYSVSYTTKFFFHCNNSNNISHTKNNKIHNSNPPREIGALSKQKICLWLLQCAITHVLEPIYILWVLSTGT